MGGVSKEWRAHLVLPFDDDDGYGSGGPAVLGGEGLVTVPQHNNLEETK